jgi:hypothetical protein
MRLTLETDEGLIETLDIRSSDATPISDDIAGLMVFDRIMLYRKYFDDYIMALSVDDFEAVKAIFARVIDGFSKELAFPGIRQAYLEDSSPQEADLF